MNEFLSALVQLPLVRDCASAKVASPSDVRRVCADIAGLAQESFHVLMLDTRNGVLSRTMAGLGLANACLVHPREVFRQAVAANAVAVILAHNHPSGDPAPSAEDLRVTRQLVAAGRILDIRVLDHVVVARESPQCPSGALSLREEGLVDFA